MRKAEGEVQRGRFDEARWSAGEARKLDPANTRAAAVEQLAQKMKPHALN